MAYAGCSRWHAGPLPSTRGSTKMYKMSHRLFALGISSAVAFFLDINLMALPLMLVLSYLIGSLPDMDLKLGFKHRGFMHNISFFLAMTLLCSLGVFYLYHVFQSLMGTDAFGAEAVFFSGFPIPSFFVKLVSLDFSSIASDTFFKTIVFFFVSFMSHFLLDIVTPQGLDVGVYHVSGAIKSGNKFFNFFFGAVGVVTFVVSMAFIIIKTFTSITINWSTWYFIIVGSLILAVVMISLFMNRGKNDNKLRCYTLDNNIDVCIPPGKCFQVGSDRDDKICNMDDPE